MNAAVRAVGNVGPAEPVESEIERLPWIRQQVDWVLYTRPAGGCQKPRSTNPCKAKTLTR